MTAVPAGRAERPMQVPPETPPPRGTWRIVTAFGALVTVGWLLLYFGLFLPRNTP